MFASFRAVGIAAAIIALSTSGVGAAPSLALDLPVQAATASLGSQVSAVQPAIVVSVPAESAQVAMPVETDPNVPATVEPAILPDAAPVTAPALPIVVAPKVHATLHATLAELVSAHRSSAIPDRESECLAGAIYFEAKGEPLPGQLAVGQVIANRAKSGRFPKSWCGVVFQRSQFSFVRGGSLPPIPRSSANWKTAVAIAHIVANELSDAVAPKALFFHARYVSPNWRGMSKVATVGNHVFYR